MKTCNKDMAFINENIKLRITIETLNDKNKILQDEINKLKNENDRLSRGEDEYYANAICCYKKDLKISELYETIHKLEIKNNTLESLSNSNDYVLKTLPKTIEKLELIMRTENSIIDTITTLSIIIILYIIYQISYQIIKFI